MIEHKVVEPSISKEDFRGLCLAVIPLIETVRKYLEDHGIDNLASITMSSDGYVDFNVNGSDWRMSRIKKGEEAQMRNDCVETFKF